MSLTNRISLLLLVINLSLRVWETEVFFFSLLDSAASNFGDSLAPLARSIGIEDPQRPN